jgi:hypothetical protein
MICPKNAYPAARPEGQAFPLRNQDYIAQCQSEAVWQGDEKLPKIRSVAVTALLVELKNVIDRGLLPENENGMHALVKVSYSLLCTPFFTCDTVLGRLTNTVMMSGPSSGHCSRPGSGAPARCASFQGAATTPCSGHIIPPVQECRLWEWRWYAIQALNKIICTCPNRPKPPQHATRATQS